MTKIRIEHESQMIKTSNIILLISFLVVHSIMILNLKTIAHHSIRKNNSDYVPGYYYYA